jgi:two-component system response regulator PilR (NtrC family)
LPANLRRPQDRHDVPLELPAEGIDLEAALDRIEHRYMQLALERVGGVQTHAAELLRVSFRQFRYKLQKFHQRRGEEPK